MRSLRCGAAQLGAFLVPTYHAGRAPDVCRGPVLCANQHLHGPVLPCLDVFREVLVLEARGDLGTGAAPAPAFPASPLPLPWATFGAGRKGLSSSGGDTLAAPAAHSLRPSQGLLPPSRRCPGLRS